MPRGMLRVYLGVAPGVGTTFAMLDEAVRRAARGADLVIATLDPHGRGPIVDLAAHLPRVGAGTSVDVTALLARRPAVVLVDDLAGDSDHEAPDVRRQAVERLLDAGIAVVATTDVRAVASLADAVEAITGERPSHTVPDWWLRAADQIEIVDMTPQAIRRRLAHGALYPPGDLDAARAARFHPRRLAALRELALAWAVGAVAGQHARWLDSLGPAGEVGDGGPTRTRERLLVALPTGPEAAVVMGRAVELAARSAGADLLVVHVLSTGRLGAPGAQAPDALRSLAEAAGAPYQEVVGDDVAQALRDVATAERCSQVVVGQRPTTSPEWRARRGVAARLGSAGSVDVHLVPLDAHRQLPALPPAPQGLSRGRLAGGFVLAVLLPAVMVTVLLGPLSSIGLAGDALLLLMAVVVTTMVGGLWPALLSAVVGSTVLNFFFIPPVHTFQVSETHNVVTLVGFLTIGALVSAVVHRAATMTAAAAQASTQSRVLAASAEAMLQGAEALPTLLEHVRSSFGTTSVSLLERRRDPTGSVPAWAVLHSTGPAAPTTPEEADVEVPAGPDLVLAMAGRTLTASDRTILGAFAAQAQGLLERDALARAAAVADRLEATERLRDALLAAVGHDLRTPIASARAAISSLRSVDVTWSAAERDELLAAAEESLARLGTLVADLLDLSRLRAGVLTVAHEPVWLDEVVPPALDELEVGPQAVRVAIPQDLPAALADPALVARIVVNVVGNALRYAGTATPPLVTASATADRVELRVVDRGPGIAGEDLVRVFTPFQRLGDTDSRSGLGLGLALSRGLVEAMGGTLEPEETPGGGLTMVVTLPVAPDHTAQASGPGRREREEPQE